MNLVANFIADVLEHPRVQQAASRTIVSGMNATVEQSDLASRITRVSLALQEENGEVSRHFGEQFPRAAASFIGGAVAGLRKKENRKLVDYELKEQASHASSGEWQKDKKVS